MAKYRTLLVDELHHFEKEFIDFLVVNGITATDWEQIKTENSTKAQSIIELFSDVVFESILRKNQYLVMQSASKLYAFYFGETKAVLLGVETSNPAINLLEVESISQTIQQNSASFQKVSTTKNYQQSREQEMFTLIQKGATLGGEEWFKAIAQL